MLRSALMSIRKVRQIPSIQKNVDMKNIDEIQWGEKRLGKLSSQGLRDA